MDPNKYKFSTVIRLTAIIIKFIQQLKWKIKVVTYVTKNDTDTKQMILSDEDISFAEQYFYKKATEEIKHFDVFQHCPSQR